MRNYDLNFTTSFMSELNMNYEEICISRRSNSMVSVKFSIYTGPLRELGPKSFNSEWVPSSGTYINWVMYDDDNDDKIMT